jgi:FtsP/CotA-like multicopper oxidase with cupredoxin domain
MRRERHRKSAWATGHRRKLALAALLLLAFAPLGLLQRHGNEHQEGEPVRAHPHSFDVHKAVEATQRFLSGQLLQAAGAQRQTNVGKLDFANRLRIPPLLSPRRDNSGRSVFDLTLRSGTSRFFSGTSTETWGVNGNYLGPTLRATRGDRVLIHVTNQLPETTTMHWHRMHLPAVADGGPHQPIEPGTSWSPTWTISQPAATLWYHPHPHGETADHVYRGVAGLFILDDAQTARLALPARYGLDDIPLIIQDKRFQADGSLDLALHGISPTGRLGDTILINGTANPHLDVTHQRIRFRLLNASDARIYNIGFVDHRRFDLIATDGGLLEAPRVLTRIQLSPGERAEIVATFEPGEDVVLRSFPPALGTNFVLDRLTGGDDSFDLIQIRAARTLARSPRVPQRLAAQTPVLASVATRTRHFELDDELRINGHQMDMNRIDEVIAADSTEMWEVRNASPLPHNFHIHGVSFQIIEYAGGLPPAGLTGPKDTVYVPPDETVHLLVRFGDYADPAHPYMFHCHLLQHEDHGMMGQFVVVKPSQAGAMPSEHQAGATPHEHHGDHLHH